MFMNVVLRQNRMYFDLLLSGGRRLCWLRIVIVEEDGSYFVLFVVTSTSPAKCLRTVTCDEQLFRVTPIMWVVIERSGPFRRRLLLYGVP